MVFGKLKFVTFPTKARNESTGQCARGDLPERSAELPVGTAYRCPIPTWTAWETHVVVRSGTQDLGQWVSEERDVYRDYVESIGGAVPANIVRIWLIAVSLFQGQEGRCQYADIAFAADDRVIPATTITGSCMPFPRQPLFSDNPLEIKERQTSGQAKIPDTLEILKALRTPR